MHKGLLGKWQKLAGQEQKDVRSEVDGASKLKVEEVCVPVRSMQGGGRVYWVPNPDGKTYDLLIHYFRQYTGPHTTVIIDLNTGEMRTE